MSNKRVFCTFFFKTKRFKECLILHVFDLMYYNTDLHASNVLCNITFQKRLTKNKASLWLLQPFMVIHRNECNVTCVICNIIHSYIFW